MKIVSGMQGTRNQEISSENKDEKPPKEKTYPQKKKTRRIGKENKGKKQKVKKA